jgi:hypothetical protein
VYLLWRAGEVDTPPSGAAAGLLLAAAVLGYSSLLVLFGLFGLALLLLLAIDAAGLAPEARKGLAGALAIGGLVAGALFYFHYVPGLLRGASAMAEGPIPSPGAPSSSSTTSRRRACGSGRAGSGSCWPPASSRRPSPSARARRRPGRSSSAWLAAWALVMVLKEPFLFPKMLRWAKEDQFVSPLLCLVLAAAVAALPRRWLRWSAAALVLAVAAALQGRDFLLHANSLLM